MPVNSLTRNYMGALFAGGLSLALAAQLHAQQAPDAHSLDSVRAAAERALRDELAHVPGVQLTAAALDPRLRLAACGAKLETHATPPRGTQARSLVRVACSQGATWSVNVPVEIRREITVFVVRRSLARGEALRATDVTPQKRVLPGLAAPYVTRLEDLNGRLTRRALAEGTAVTADALTAALLIHRGQTVTLAASAGGIEVRAPGRALADASALQRLRVQNLDSLKVVEGVAESEGVVRVNP
ncbi:MAG TPA: flagellar basal body P-ring formation chaperone FlgA [Steroidobacteraceae bacterium]|nr:flagellar basal body P-ring formation chaperone FlgA [Steroidobacteraceae bacterium]